MESENLALLKELEYYSALINQHHESESKAVNKLNVTSHKETVHTDNVKNSKQTVTSSDLNTQVGKTESVFSKKNPYKLEKTKGNDVTKLQVRSKRSEVVVSKLQTIPGQNEKYTKSVSLSTDIEASQSKSKHSDRARHVSNPYKYVKKDSGSSSQVIAVKAVVQKHLTSSSSKFNVDLDKKNGDLDKKNFKSKSNHTNPYKYVKGGVDKESCNVVQHQDNCAKINPNKNFTGAHVKANVAKLDSGQGTLGITLIKSAGVSAEIQSHSGDSGTSGSSISTNANSIIQVRDITKSGNITHPGNSIKTGTITKPGNVAEPGKCFKTETITKPGNISKVRNITKNASVTETGYITKPGNISKVINTAKTASVTQTGNITQTANITIRGNTTKPGSGTHTESKTSSADKPVDDIHIMLSKIDSIKKNLQQETSENRQGNSSENPALLAVKQELNKINSMKKKLKSVASTSSESLGDPIQSKPCSTPKSMVGNKFKFDIRKNTATSSKEVPGKTVVKNKYKFVKKTGLQNKPMQQNRNTPVLLKTKYKLVKSGIDVKSHSSYTSAGFLRKGPYKLVKGKSKQQTQHPPPSQPSVFKSSLVRPAGKQYVISPLSYKTSNSNFVGSRHKLIKKSLLVVQTGERRRSDSGSFRGRSSAVARSQSLVKSSRYKLVKYSMDKARTKPRQQPQRQHKTVRPKRTKYSIVKSKEEMENEAVFDINKALGRTIENASKNKYKFIKRKPKTKLAKASLPGKAKMKLDRRPKSTLLKKEKGHKGSYIMLRGQLYQKHGRNLVKMGSTTKIRRSLSKLAGSRRNSLDISTEKVSSITQWAARNAVVKSIVLQHKYKRDHRTTNNTKNNTTKDCIYYRRFGKCSRGTKCPFQHDKKKVAVCTRFIRGTCKVDNCPFSHNLSREKMPVCRFFLKGHCDKENCPYLHVNVGRDAEICQDFVAGYCKAGEQCKKQHILWCPEHEQTGKCSQGKACKLKHANTYMKSTKKTIPEKTNKKPPLKSSSKEISHQDLDDINLPMKERKLPAYISINTASDPVEADLMEMEPKIRTNTNEQSQVFQIRPNLNFLPDTMDDDDL